MKAVITATRFIKQYESRYGDMFLHSVSYDGKEALYSSKSEDQNKFVPGEEVEFTETLKTNKRGEEYITIKPIVQGTGNFSKSMKREQSKYSGFAMAYAKDLVVADKITLDKMYQYTESMFFKMVDLDKTLES